MAASVTVHHSAFGSDRIARLAELAGYNIHEARGRMALLWSVCTELQTEGVLSKARVRACIGDRGDDHLVEAELGELLETGDIRVKGCEGRIEWFGEQQDGRVVGGKTRAANADRDVRGRMLPRPKISPATQVDSSSNHLSESDQDPDPENTLSGSPVSPELPDPGPRGDRDQDPGPQLALVTDPTPVDTAISNPGPTRSLDKLDLRRRLFVEAWQFSAMQFFELRAAGVDSEARNSWDAMPSASSYEAKALFARIDELIIGDAPNVERAREVLRNRVLVAAAEARHKLGHLRFMTPARMWDEKSFSLAKDWSPEQIEAAARASPRGGSREAAEPVRRMPFLSKP